MILTPGNQNPPSIVLQTRDGLDIRNVQALPLSQLTISQFPTYESKFPHVETRSLPSGQFNCHGLTFASRRTCIEDAQSVMQVILHDGYHEVELKDILPGDVVLYHNDGDVEHSAVVVQKTYGLLGLPLVISKWGSYKELLHPVNYCPYCVSDIRYYRMTPW